MGIGQRYVSSAITTQMTRPGPIVYLVLLPPEGSGEYSAFQGFSLNVFPVTGILHQLCHLPATIEDLFETRDEVIRRRAAGVGGYTIGILESALLVGFAAPAGLVCVISSAHDRSMVCRHLEENPELHWLHVTTDPDPGPVPSLSALSRETLTTWVVTTPALSLSMEQREYLARLAATTGDWPPTTVETPARQHNITAPTELALASVRIGLADPQPLRCAEDDDYASALAATAQELRRIRDDALTGLWSIPGTPTLIVAVPSVFRHLSHRRDLRGASKPLRVAITRILRQRQYTAIRETMDDPEKLLEDPLAQAAFVLRAEELRCYTAALAVAGASLFCPVLRCPPQTDRVRELLLRLAGIIKGGNPSPERISDMAIKVGQMLLSSIPQPILEEIKTCFNAGVKLIGDTPLELLPVDGVPLALRSITSRLPTLPGNLLMRQAFLRMPLLLRPEQFRKILLVRAFAHDDPIRDTLKKAIEIFMREASHQVELVVSDVDSKEEFVNAFNAFDGDVAIFDGHGSHTRGQEGTIVVGTIQFNPLELYPQIRVPPIVILSACETHTFEGWEASVAGAFLLMGCRSVLGTLAPIDAKIAAVLVARFVYRLSSFLPTLKHTTPWSQIVTGMLRMSYATDVLDAMKRHFALGEQTINHLYKTVQFRANLDINDFRGDWFDRVITGIARELGCQDSEVRAAWQKRCYFSETMRYVHLGQPEHIFVVPESTAPRDEPE